MKMNQRGILRINRTLWFLKMTHAWRKQVQTLLKISTSFKLPFSATLLSLFSAALACFFQHVINQTPPFAIFDSSLLSCWVIGLFHWLKWRTSQVNKCLNVAVLHPPIVFSCVCDQSSHSLGSPNWKASKESTCVSFRRCRIPSTVLLLSLYWLTGLCQTLSSLSGRPSSLVSTQGAQGTLTKLSQATSLSSLCQGNSLPSPSVAMVIGDATRYAELGIWDKYVWRQKSWVETCTITV